MGHVHVPASPYVEDLLFFWPCPCPSSLLDFFFHATPPPAPPESAVVICQFVMEWLDVQLVSQAATTSTTCEGEWLDVCAVARASGRADHREGGSVAALRHCSRMRDKKRTQIPKVAPHVLKRIDKHNRLANRGTDIIDVSEKKVKKIKGRWGIQATHQQCNTENLFWSQVLRITSEIGQEAQVFRTRKHQCHWCGSTGGID